MMKKLLIALAFVCVAYGGVRVVSIIWPVDWMLAVFAGCAVLLWLIEIAQDLLGVPKRDG